MKLIQILISGGEERKSGYTRDESTRAALASPLSRWQEPSDHMYYVLANKLHCTPLILVVSCQISQPCSVGQSSDNYVVVGLGLMSVASREGGEIWCVLIRSLSGAGGVHFGGLYLLHGHPLLGTQKQWGEIRVAEPQNSGMGLFLRSPAE